MSEDAPPVRSVPFTTALKFWLKLGFISFGGPAGQIAIMFHELVERRRWISERRFLHALNYCMLLPGPQAQQLATYVGWLMHGTWGGIVAGSLFVLPSLFLLIALSWVYVAFGDAPVVAGIFYGIQPAVVAIVLHAAHRIGSRALKNAWLWGIAAAAFVAIFVFNAPFPAIVAAAAVVGTIGGRLMPARFAIGSSHSLHASVRSPALVDDTTPRAPHTSLTHRRLAQVTIIGLVLWSGLLGLLLLEFGWNGTLTQMGWFFTKAALVTFGGAYAVLPYVYQGAVEHYGWVTAPQMAAGLALGETTPGPLIMIVSFVGFVAGFTHELFGNARFAAGVAGAVVATVFTFLPSFVFIFAGAPLVESTYGNQRWMAPLTAITAAVVGVILNLALFFAAHALWPQGHGGPFDTRAAAIATACAIALFRLRLGVLPVIAGAALVGLASRLLGG
ncbi:Chromate transport protein [bacterium HR30]|nr:Chromate transport protein [bacterium HR30]